MRKMVPLNFGWRFSDHADASCRERDFNCQSWELVDIPHANKELPLHYFDDRTCCFVSWYRKEVTIAPEARGRRVILRFEGVSSYAIIYANGVRVGEHKGGYTPFEVELTAYAVAGETLVLVVEVDASERPEIPPFGGVIDYLTYGGIYREVSLRYVDMDHIENISVRAIDPLAQEKWIEVSVESHLCDDQPWMVTVEVFSPQGDSLCRFNPVRATASTVITGMVPQAMLWEVDAPVLYRAKVQLGTDDHICDETTVVFGIRKAQFTPEGFFLNGHPMKLRGLNRHQSYPYVGYAMPASQQRADAELLRFQLGVDIVRTSHYPQSPAFLDRCDEIGLLVFTEIPGWQHLDEGKEWRALVLQQEREMIERDRNHPSIVLWGVRINESADDDDLYRATNDLAHQLDPTRQTGGVRNFRHSHVLEDVYTYNDFVHRGDNRALESPHLICKDSRFPYLVTEHNGHMFPTKSYDTEDKRLEHALRHARVLDAMYASQRICGAIGWCMSDYNTHRDFGGGDQVCYHGVTDMFRIPKLAAYIYASQQDRLPVLEISSHMDIGEHAGHYLGEIGVFTNCDSVDVYCYGKRIGTYVPDRKRFPHLPHPPVMIGDFIGDRLESETRFSQRDCVRLKKILINAGRYGMDLPLRDKISVGLLLRKYHMAFDQGMALFTTYVGWINGQERLWRFEGRLKGEVVCIRECGCANHPALHIEADRTLLHEQETYDVIALKVTARSERGSILQFCNDPVDISSTGPIQILGPRMVSLSGGAVGVYVRSCGVEGPGSVTVGSPNLGTQTLSVQVG